VPRSPSSPAGVNAEVLPAAGTLAGTHAHQATGIRHGAG
jgi:hypothetical protein